MNRLIHCFLLRDAQIDTMEGEWETAAKLSNGTFGVAGPAAWNSLPPAIRTASTLCTFKNLLKTRLFIHSFQLST